MESKIAITPQTKVLTDPSISPFKKYVEYSYGELSFGFFVFELIIFLFSNLTGLLGFGLRAIFYPLLFKSAGKGIAFGKGATFRRPKQIIIGKGVLIDDYVTFDVRGMGSITIMDKVSIGRFTSIVAKDSDIVIKAGANIGSYCRVATQSGIEIGESVLVAGFCYLGPGNHLDDNKVADAGDKESLIERGMELKGGVKIEDHVWIGTHSTVMDGVTLGKGCIVGAYSLVKKSVEGGKTIFGIPAKVSQP